MFFKGGERPVFRRVTLDGVAIAHCEASLGEGVTANIVRLVKLYAERAGLRHLPPITLGQQPHEGWDRPWREITASPPVAGLAVDGRGVVLSLVESSPPADSAQGVEAAVAHAIARLRWGRGLDQAERDARTRALLRGATFPPGRGWPRETHAIMAAARLAAREER